MKDKNNSLWKPDKRVLGYATKFTSKFPIEAFSKGICVLPVSGRFLRANILSYSNIIIATRQGADLGKHLPPATRQGAALGKH